MGHLAGELLKSTQKIDIVHVPFQGATAAIKEVAAGNVEMLFVTLPPAMGQVQKAARWARCAVSTPERASVIPNVPAMREFGYAQFDFGAWQGVLVPAGTPAAIVERLNRDINALLKEPEASGALVKLGFTPVGGTPEPVPQADHQQHRQMGQSRARGEHEAALRLRVKSQRAALSSAAECPQFSQIRHRRCR